VSETAELAAALAAAQAELPEVGKNRSADVKNKEGRFLYAYSYADLADVSAAVLPVLGRHGLAFTAFPGHQPDGKFGLRYYLLHSGGARLEGFFEIDDKGGMQLVGGRITYARRYCLCAVTGITADEDVDVRGDGQQQHSPTAQRKPRAQSSPPAQAAPPRAAAPASPRAGAGGDLPPLPDEDGPDPTTSGASSSARAPGSGSQRPSGAPSPSSPSGSATTPNETDYDTAGTVTPAQLTAIWTVLSKTYHFGADEKDAARGVCAQILSSKKKARVELKSSTDLSKTQAGTVLDTLAKWQEQAKTQNEEPRGYLMLMLQSAQDAAGTVPGE
jgi:hypothetical protein